MQDDSNSPRGPKSDLVCFGCGGPVAYLHDEIVHAAVMFVGSPGYGSFFDNTLLCEESLRIAICDSCLKQHEAKIKLAYTPRPERVEATLRPWRSTYSCEDEVMFERFMSLDVNRNNAIARRMELLSEEEMDLTGGEILNLVRTRVTERNLFAEMWNQILQNESTDDNA